MATNTRANSTKTVNVSETSNATLKKQLDTAKAAFASEKTVPLAIPQTFRKTFGSEMFIGINGVFINVPIDGESHLVPEPFYLHAMQAINAIQ